MDKKICKRCLLRDMNDGEYYESVLRYRRTMPQKQRTPDDAYEARIEVCSACEWLSNGVCGQCGCYVEMRAASVKMKCPMGFWK